MEYSKIHNLQFNTFDSHQSIELTMLLIILQIKINMFYVALVSLYLAHNITINIDNIFNKFMH